MLAAELVIVLLWLPVCSFAPGFFFVRRLRWGPMEKLCGSVGLSVTLLYLATWATYAAAGRVPAVCCYGVAAISVAAAAAARRDAMRLFRTARVRQALAGFAFLLVWSLLMLSMIRHYSGADWLGDWQEHLQRSLFFLRGFPANTPIFGGYQLAARPPLMNVLAAFYMGLTEDRFEVDQLVFVFLNLLLFLACLLVLPALAGRRARPGGRAVLPLVAIFAMSPVVMEAVTYTWTKALTAFFVVLALWFYLAANRKGDRMRMTAAFLALSAGLLTHYSAGPYVVLVGAHYLFTGLRSGPGKLKELAGIAALCTVLLFTWLGWSLAVYGVRTTFASNTSVTSSQQYAGSNVEKIAGNLFDSMVPGMLRDPALARAFDQPSEAGTVRDKAFVLYQRSLIFGMGATGGLLAAWLWVSAWRRWKDTGREGRFWLAFVPCAVVLGIAVVGERNVNGSAHLTLLPVAALGLTWLAAMFCRRRWAAGIIVAGMLVDFPVGVFLQARVENLENSPQRTVFHGLSYTNGRVAVGQPLGTSASAWSNWLDKHNYALCQEWLHEMDRASGGGAQSGHAADIRRFLQDRVSQDASMWQGWFARHGGSVSYFGDAFGEGWAAGGVLVTLWVGLLWMAWRRMPAAVALKKEPGKKPGKRR